MKGDELVDLTTSENCVPVHWVYVQQCVDWPGRLLEKRSFVTGKAEVSNGQKIDCWRGLYSSHAERYRWPRVRCQRVGSVYKYDG